MKEMDEVVKKIELKKGVQYKLCTCGTTKILPFCDETHKVLNEETGSNFKSLRITTEEDVVINVTSKNWKVESKNK
jgi:CDGSH-type Zn-finger protein